MRNKRIKSLQSCKKMTEITSAMRNKNRKYVELQDQWNGPYFFFLKSIAQPPVNKTAPIFFFYGVFP